MAGVPREIVERAVAISKRFEERTTAYESNKKKDQLLHLDLQADASYRKFGDISKCSRTR